MLGCMGEIYEVAIGGVVRPAPAAPEATENTTH